MSVPRVVITGMGAITCQGRDAVAVWDAMVNGRSGIATIVGEEFDRWKGQWPVTIGGQVRDWDPFALLGREANRMDRYTQLGMHAAIEAVGRSGIDFAREDPERCGVVIGSGVGGIDTIERGVELLGREGPSKLSPFTVPRLMINCCAGLISIRFGLKGLSVATASACSSSGHALAAAMHEIRRGDADVMVAGGAEATVTPVCVSVFSRMKALSTRNAEPERASRPFDRERDGFVMAEGAAVFLLESEEHARRRGAEILAVLSGAGVSSDASHITAPDPEGRGAILSMRRALKDANLDASAVDYINAHGTSTPLGDAAEVAAVKALFGTHARKLSISSTKSMHGHHLGASGAVETIACVNALRLGVMPPTINLEDPDEGFDLDFVPKVAKERPVRVAMNNTFGFGGHNVTLILARP
jgi:3-oxoacyl-[acyl-carrier-protein] synthase II